jgi:hypothetical protein
MSASAQLMGIYESVERLSKDEARMAVPLVKVKGLNELVEDLDGRVLPGKLEPIPILNEGDE